MIVCALPMVARARRYAMAARIPVADLPETLAVRAMPNRDEVVLRASVVQLQSDPGS